LLITPEEVGYILGNEVASEVLYLRDQTGCRYISVIDENVVLQVYVTTDATMKRSNQPSHKKWHSDQFYSAAEMYEMRKMAELRIQKKIPEVFKVEDIENFGDQAFLTEAVFFGFHVLNNDIFYEFVTRTNDDGIGYDALMKLAQIALQRMP